MKLVLISAVFCILFLLVTNLHNIWPRVVWVFRYLSRENVWVKLSEDSAPYIVRNKSTNKCEIKRQSFFYNKLNQQAFNMKAVRFFCSDSEVELSVDHRNYKLRIFADWEVDFSDENLQRLIDRFTQHDVLFYREYLRQMVETASVSAILEVGFAGLKAGKYDRYLKCAREKLKQICAQSGFRLYNLKMVGKA